MIIGISTEGKDLGNMLDPRFGRAKFFIIYDTDKDKVVQVIDNNINVNARGGAGSSSAQILAKEGAQAVISGNFGPNAVMGLSGFEIKMYTAEVDRIQNVITRFKKGQLKETSSATVAGKH